jgi:hypothetical protein
LKTEVKVFWWLAASFVVGLLFDLIPFAPSQPKKLFAFVDGRDFGMTLEWYVYLAGEKISRMMIFYALFLATGFRIVQVFLWLEVLDLVDFMLLANKPWFQILGFDVEFNHWKLCIIVTVFVLQWIKQHSSGFSE